MPLYEYDCQDCGPFTELRPMAASASPCPCPDCGAVAPRAFLTAPMLACVAGDRRTAIETNEKAANRPLTSGEYAAKQAEAKSKRHRSGCSCCGTAPRKKTATVKAPNGAKAFPSKRPWMISH